METWWAKVLTVYELLALVRDGGEEDDADGACRRAGRPRRLPITTYLSSGLKMRVYICHIVGIVYIQSCPICEVKRDLA